MYQVIDNLLSKRDFNNIKDYFPTKLNWGYSNSVAGPDTDTNIKYNLDDYMFNHLFYLSDPFMISREIHLIMPIIAELNIKNFIRCKANFYSRTEEIIEHDYHVDLTDDHLVAIYYVNTNNGFTILKDHKKIESVENRLLIFDGKIEHASTSSSDGNRMNINFNYVPNVPKGNKPDKKEFILGNYS